MAFEGRRFNGSSGRIRFSRSNFAPSPSGFRARAVPHTRGDRRRDWPSRRPSSGRVRVFTLGPKMEHAVGPFPLSESIVRFGVAASARLSFGPFAARNRPALFLMPIESARIARRISGRSSRLTLNPSRPLRNRRPALLDRLSPGVPRSPAARGGRPARLGAHQRRHADAHGVPQRAPGRRRVPRRALRRRHRAARLR